MAQVQASMAGMVLQILVSTGEQVETGQDVVVLESMKMEVPVQTEYAGKVKEVKVEVGSYVSEGEVLVELEVE